MLSELKTAVASKVVIDVNSAPPKQSIGKCCGCIGLVGFEGASYASSTRFRDVYEQEVVLERNLHCETTKAMMHRWKPNDWLPFDESIKICGTVSTEAF